MSERNVVQIGFDTFAKRSGFSKHSGSWYRTGSDVITVLNLQKSQYGPKYYINVGLWLLALEEATYPKSHTCHVGTRLGQLVGEDEQLLKNLLDMDVPMAEEMRAMELDELLKKHLLPVLEACSGLNSLRMPAGAVLIRKSLVTGPARQFLDAHGE